jgi:MYXO-CTERM domain-containing protein
MTHRALAALTLALTLSLPTAALADPDGGTVTDPTCSVASQTQSGETCQECQISGTDTACQDELGNDYSFVCQYSSTLEIWCNGPSRDVTQSTGCAFGVGSAGGPAGGAALAALVGIAAWATRRRRR